jgi:hypothetical protein
MKFGREIIPFKVTSIQQFSFPLFFNHFKMVEDKISNEVKIA